MADIAPPASVTIRGVSLADISDLSALARRTWQDAFGNAFSPEDGTADAEERRSEAFFERALHNSVILVAELDGQLAGYTKFGAVNKSGVDATSDDRELHRLYVETRLHRRGIGRALLTAALEHPELANADRVFLDVWAENHAAVALYKSLGFSKAGVHRYRIGSQEIEDDVFVRRRPDL